MKRRSSFFFSQKRNGFDKTSSAIMSFHLIVNDILKNQTTPLDGSPVIFCLMQTGTLWRNRVAVFFINGKMASRNRSLLTQIRVEICRTLYTPNDNPWALLPLIRSKMLIPVDHKQYVEADRRQLRSKVSSHHFFHKNQHLKYQRVPNRFFRIRDWVYLKAGIWEF